MKYLALLALLVLLSPATQAQDERKTTMTASKKSDRVSPQKSSTSTYGDLQVNLEYSSPGVKNRNIWGELVPYGKVWRTGANEASTIEFSRDVMIHGKRVRAGKYALFTIPGENEWQVILNTEPDQWGAFKYDEAKDAMRFSIKPEQTEFTERLAIDANADEQKKCIRIRLAWEKLSLSWEVQ